VDLSRAVVAVTADGALDVAIGELDLCGGGKEGTSHGDGREAELLGVEEVPEDVAVGGVRREVDLQSLEDVVGSIDVDDAKGSLGDEERVRMRMFSKRGERERLTLTPGRLRLMVVTPLREAPETAKTFF
jgi:hypothetical protein